MLQGSFPVSYATSYKTIQGSSCARGSLLFVLSTRDPKKVFEPIHRQVINSLSASDGLETRCPVDFALLVRQYGSRPETTWETETRGWHDPPLFHQVRA